MKTIKKKQLEYKKSEFWTPKTKEAYKRAIKAMENAVFGK